MARVASFHLVRHDRAVTALRRLGTDRLRRPEGLVLRRLLGTGRGADTGPSADLCRTAMVAVWEDEAALERYLAAAGGRRGVVERYDVRLRALGGHGTWRGVDVLAGVARGSPGGPVAVLTRAGVRLGAWRSFRAAGPAVSAELAAADGLLAALGVGELPVGRLGTFSLWTGLPAVRAFAMAPHHRDVVRRTRAERWYAEELFVRFEPYAASGTWDGRDPLA
jgi:hypothetical protein